MTLKQVIEGLLFAADRPLLPKEVAGILRAVASEAQDEAGRAYLKLKEAEAGEALEALKAEYAESDRPFHVVERAAGWQLVTRPEYAPWVRMLYPESRPARLSGPALETLAIIAYRQPITKADIEAVRGVAVDGVVQSLLERSLLRIAGRAEVPGRPLLYATTEVFLNHFGLKSLDELPNSDELRRMQLPTGAPSSEATEPVEEQLTLGVATTEPRPDEKPDEKPVEEPSGSSGSDPAADRVSEPDSGEPPATGNGPENESEPVEEEGVGG
jgi:segregation and condensation protein B